MRTQNLTRLTATAALWLVAAAPASAIPTLSLDLDPLTVGIQNVLTLSPFDFFTVDVVITGDGATVFDTIVADLGFNDAATILSFTGSIIAGPLATLAPVLSVDVFGGGVAVPGTSLTGLSSLALPPFTATTGGAGLGAAVQPFTPIGNGVEVTAFSVGFIAGATAGTSQIGLLGFPFGSSLLALVGQPVNAALTGASVTVVPEPGTWLLLGSSLASLFVYRR